MAQSTTLDGRLLRLAEELCAYLVSPRRPPTPTLAVRTDSYLA